MLIFETVIANIKAKKTIDANDVIELRKAGYKDMAISSFEIAQLIALNHDISTEDDSFASYYIEALGDFAFGDNNGENQVSFEKAEIIVEKISKDGRITNLNDLNALRNIIKKAYYLPTIIINFILGEIEKAIVENKGITRNIRIDSAPYINEFEVEILKDIFYAASSKNGATINIDEAEYLFNLKDIVRNGNNFEGFKDFFVKTIANYLQAHNFDADNSWALPNRKNVFQILKEILNYKAENAWNENISNEKIENSNKIDTIENEWLQKIIHRDNKVDEYEQAVLEYIAQ